MRWSTNDAGPELRRRSKHSAKSVNNSPAVHIPFGRRPCIFTLLQLYSLARGTLSFKELSLPISVVTQNRQVVPTSHQVGPWGFQIRVIGPYMPPDGSKFTLKSLEIIFWSECCYQHASTWGQIGRNDSLDTVFVKTSPRFDHCMHSYVRHHFSSACTRFIGTSFKKLTHQQLYVIQSFDYQVFGQPYSWLLHSQGCWGPRAWCSGG
jgi:hypothetical protein